MEKVCERCRTVCFSEEEFTTHECFDYSAMIGAEIAVCNWDGTLEEGDEPRKRQVPS